MQKSTLTALRAGAAPLALTMALVSAPAFAQDASPVATVSADDVENSDEVIVVTGTIFQNVVTPSPVTTITTENLDARGISTTQ